MKLKNLEKFSRWHSKIYALTHPLFLTKRKDSPPAPGILPQRENSIPAHGLQIHSASRVSRSPAFPPPAPARPFRVVSLRIIFSAEGKHPILSFDIAPNT